MRQFLLILGWLSLVGSVFDAAIIAFLGWLVATDAATLTITVDTHLRDHLSFLYWVKGIAEFLFPQWLVVWVFDLPALVYFPIRVFSSVFVGYWALKVARRM